jgi:sugar lactone lactonase YvrE
MKIIVKNLNPNKLKFKKPLALALFLLLSCMCVLPLVNAIENVTYVTQYNQVPDYGTFIGPKGVAIDSVSDTPGFWVADSGHNKIIKISNVTGQLLANATGAPGGLKMPTGCAVNGSGYLYVSDTSNNRIVVFSKSGAYVDSWGGLGTGDGQFNSPAGIAINSIGNVFVGDMGNNRVQVFESDGTYLDQWGVNGVGNGQFKGASGVAIDSQDNVYVTDFGNNRIQKFTSTGDYITQWGSGGSTAGLFNVPIDLAIDSHDLVYVTDTFVTTTSNHRVQIFTNTGQYLAQWGTKGPNPGEFNQPWRLDFDGNQVYVVENGNNRVQVFQLPPIQQSTSLTIQVSPPTVNKYGANIATISGRLTSSSNGVPTKTILLSYYNQTELSPVEHQITASVTTDVNGYYSFQWDVPTDVPNGYYIINATFNIDLNYAPSSATTTPNSLFVVPEYALGGLAAICACFVGFAIFKKRSSLSTHLKRI